MDTASKILVVDDEPFIRDSLKDALELEGYQVSLAPNGRAALQVFGEERFDLVISDVRMPNGDGLELLRWIREAGESGKSVPFFLITGNSDLHPETARNHGADRLFAKPFEVDELLAAVAGAIR